MSNAAVSYTHLETDGRKLFKVGVNFSKKSRNIEKWIRCV